MANVGFLRGSQANLNTLMTGKTGIKEGSFYLTNDTNRLYIGKTGGEVAAVNEGVITVDAVANLPTGSNRITGSFLLCHSRECTLRIQWKQLGTD